MALLTASAVVIFAIYFSANRSDAPEQAAAVSFYEKFTTNDALFARLPASYSPEQAEAIRREIDDFYKAAWSDHINKTALYEVSKQIEQIMADDRIAEKEVQSLLALIRKRRALS